MDTNRVGRNLARVYVFAVLGSVLACVLVVIALVLALLLVAWNFQGSLNGVQ